MQNAGCTWDPALAGLPTCPQPPVTRPVSRALSETWLTLLSEHMLNSVFVEPLEQVPHEPGTCGSGEASGGRRSTHPRS
jgi:hypothetical protein